MSKPIGYFMGDEVKIRASFCHSDQIVAVEAVYTNADEPTYTFTLQGNPDLSKESKTIGAEKHSTVDLRAVWDAAQLPGLYSMQRLVFYTFSGTAIHDTPLAIADEKEWPVFELYSPAHSIRVTNLEPDPSD